MSKDSFAIPNRKTVLTIPEIDRMLADLKHSKSRIPEYLEEPIAMPQKHNIKEIHLKIEEASQQIYQIFAYIRKNDKVPVEQIKNDILPIIRRAAEVPQVFYLVHEMQSKDEYTYRHNISVGVIATIIGQWLGMKPKELDELALAALMHDIGKTKIDDAILNKPGRLTEEEYEEIKNHTIYGYELLKKVPGLPDSIAITALQHHERENGGGYPLLLSGKSIHKYAKIVAVADVFHAMSSDRVYHKAIPFYKVMKEMNDGVYGSFDPNILVIFLKKIMNSLVGKQIELTNGTLGNIIMVNPYDPMNSLVKTTRDEIIDLSLHKDLEIEKVLK